MLFLGGGVWVIVCIRILFDFMCICLFDKPLPSRWTFAINHFFYQIGASDLEAVQCPCSKLQNICKLHGDIIAN